jgi:hypothetical protein
MKIIKAESIRSMRTSEKREIRRGELLNFSTNGDPHDLVAVAFFNQTETLEFENAETDDGNPWQIEHEGATYETIEMTRGSSPGVWRFIKCIRSIPTHE